MILKFIQTFITNIVKIKKSGIMKDYKKFIENLQYKDKDKDKYIYKWIQKTLESMECPFSKSGNNFKNKNSDLNINNKNDFKVNNIIINKNINEIGKINNNIDKKRKDNVFKLERNNMKKKSKGRILTEESHNSFDNIFNIDIL